jgi:CheY-like chemotaxis protein
VVADTGQGLSPDDLDRVFVPFERLGAEQTETEGTGIGLPLAKALTEAMGGRLSASSVPGEGSAFTITLPRAQDVTDVPPPRAAPASPARPPAPSGATLSILYIEDNPANIEVVSRFLKSRPNTLLQAVRSGRAGLACAVRDVPDLILLDLHLHDLHGEQVLKELRAEPVTAAIPVVILSADATPGVIRRLLAGGALAFLTKPLDLTEFGELLDSFPAPAQDHQVRTAAQRPAP